MLTRTTITHFFFTMLVISLPISKGATSVVVAILFLLSLLKLRDTKLKIQPTDWVLLSPIAVFLVLAISLLYSANLKRGIALLYRQNALLLFPIIFYQHKGFLWSQIPKYIQCFIYAVLGTSLLTLLFFVLPENTTLSITENFPILKDYAPQHQRVAFGAYSPFIDRLQFGYLIGIAILMQLWRIATAARPLLNGILLIILLSTLLILGARGAQIAILISLAVWIVIAYKQFIHPYIQKWIGKFASIGLAIFGIAFFLLVLPYWAYKSVPAFAERYNQLRWEIRVFQLDDLQSHDYVHFTSIRRIMSWNNSCKLIQQHPIFGTGIGDMEAQLERLYQEDNLGFPVNSHHQFLYYWASAGLLALLTFCISYFGFCRYAWKQKKWQVKALGLSFGLFFFIVFMLDVPLLYQVGSTSFYTFFCLFLLLKK